MIGKLYIFILFQQCRLIALAPNQQPYKKRPNTKINEKFDLQLHIGTANSPTIAIKNGQLTIQQKYVQIHNGKTSGLICKSIRFSWKWYPIKFIYSVTTQNTSAAIRDQQLPKILIIEF